MFILLKIFDCFNLSLNIYLYLQKLRFSVSRQLAMEGETPGRWISPLHSYVNFFILILLFVYLFYSALPGFDEIVSPSARSSGPDRVRLSSYLTLFFSLNLCWWLLMSCLTCNYRPLTQRSISFKTVIVTMLKVVKSKKMNLIYMIFLKNHLILKSHMI